MEILLSPPLAFLIYIPLVSFIYGFGRLIAGPGRNTSMKSSIYASGEEPPTITAAPGYKPFFLIAFFFAVIHLGILVLATGGLNAISGVFLAGLLLALVALILG